jgi:hypothetical protein
LNEKTHPPLDVEELSDSLLLDERSGRKDLVAKTNQPPQAPAPAVSHPAVQLPKPNPPPRPEVSARPIERAPPRRVEGDEAAENLPTVELRQLTPPYKPPTAEPSPPARSPAPPPPEPRPPIDVGSDIELTTLPRGMRSSVLSVIGPALRDASTLLSKLDAPYNRVRAQLRERPRRWAFLVLAPAVLGAGGVVAIRLARSRSHDSAHLAHAAAAKSSAAPAVQQPESLRSPIPDPPSPTCVRAGEPHIIAPNAMVAAGIEVRAFGGDIAIGFAANDHQAMLVRLDPKSLSVVESSTSTSTQPIRRVAPISGQNGHLSLAVDADRKGDLLRGRRTLPVDPPLQVGVADSHLAWAPWNRDVARNLWPLDRDVTVEALQGVQSASDPSSVVIAFRSSGAEWVGAAAGLGSLTPKGGLFRLDGLGPMVGSPAIAVNDGVVLMAWADRASADQPWRLRWARFKVGESPSAPRAFTPPPGGSGDQAMSPGLAVVPGGRFLLTWTQGPTSGHEVRGLTLWADGSPLGEPLNLSTSGSNAGQSQAAVTADGRGLVAFLESTPTGFQVAVTSVMCAQ